MAAAAAPPNGYGRLVVDVVDGPAPVQRIQMMTKPVDAGGGRTIFRFFESPQVFCAAAPCAVDVPAGNVLLGFPVIGKESETEVELVHVGVGDASVYRRALSVYQDESGGLRVFGIIAASVGGAAVMTGTALLPIGLSKEHDGLTTAGGISLGVGAAVLAFGIWAIRKDSPTYRPGSSNHFPLAR